MLGSGLANINLWYPWQFSFRGDPLLGGVDHDRCARRPRRREASRDSSALRPHAETAERPSEAESRREAAAVLADRRGFLAGVFATSGLLDVDHGRSDLPTVGRSRCCRLAGPTSVPRDFPSIAPRAPAGVLESARSPDYRLVVDGKVARPLVLTLDDLRAMPQHSAELPIACVEGWSSSAALDRRTHRRPAASGRRAPGARGRACIRSSNGAATAPLTSNPTQAHDRDTLLALRVGGEELSPRPRLSRFV